MMWCKAKTLLLVKFSIQFAHKQLSCLQASFKVWYSWSYWKHRWHFQNYYNVPSQFWEAAYLVFTIKQGRTTQDTHQHRETFLLVFQRMFPLCVWSILTIKRQINANGTEMKTQVEIQQSVCLKCISNPETDLESAGCVLKSLPVHTHR